MNKMAKGALATGVGVALLLGGGGTLAVWNQSVEANAGTIAAGDLNLQPKTDSTNGWYNGAGTKIEDIAAYRIVPGETLTYKHLLDITLVGAEMKADLSVTGLPTTGVFANNAVIGPVTVMKGNVDVLADAEITPAEAGTVTASSTFTFKEETGGRTNVGASADLGNVSFKLEQIAPTKAP
ncbi:alternate-type signal peptide domain-containing protein [Arthrobacter sp. 3Tela_A]|uniref:alternate-type signal peptide domain-containing protein n=1 Tax=Arthrobacter sp. 3Tela_A TaxID=3093743 RepID=UPI003BB666F1